MVVSVDSKIRRAIISKLEPGEDVLEGLERIARDNSIRSGQLSAIGAISGASLGYFDVRNRKYRDLRFETDLEVLSCLGNVSRLEDGSVVIHAHMIVADSEGNCFGGHLMRGCRVSVTLEVVIFEMEDELLRARDAKTGLNLLSLGHARSSSQ